MSDQNLSERLEDDLDRAKARGRWLSDDEQAELDREADARAIQVEAKHRRDRKLVILTGVCLLIPPLWPLALGVDPVSSVSRDDGQDRAGCRCGVCGHWAAAGRYLGFGDGLAGSAVVLIQARPINLLFSPRLLFSPQSCRRGREQSRPT